MSTFIRLRLLPLRVVWVVLALCAGPPGADALDGRSTSVTVVAVAVCWLGWGAALVAMLVPRTSSLTAVRILVPGALAATIAAVGVGGSLTALDVVALVAASIATVLVLLPTTVDCFVDGSSYGPERRIALRTPAALALLATITWVVMLGGAAAGVLLLAAGQWITGLVAFLVGAALVWFGARSIHQLSKRWLVLVPTGMVLHDPLVMPEPQLFLRQTISEIGPAVAEPADELTTEDLTTGASGLVMSLTVTEPVELLLRTPTGTTLRPVERVLFSPALPAELLAEARKRRLPTT